MKTSGKILSLSLAVLMMALLLPMTALAAADGGGRFGCGSGFPAYEIGGLDDRLDGPPAPGGLTPAAPTSKGGNDGMIGGVTTDMEYSLDNGENWIPVTSIPITGLAPGKVLVRVAGTDTVKPGAAAEVTVPEYSGPPGKEDGPDAPEGLTPVAPTGKDRSDGKVTGVDETMEYSFDGGATWRPVVGTAVTGLISGINVTVRVRETETTKAGKPIMVVIPDFVKADGPAAPSGLSAAAPTSKDGTDGRITGVDETMEYSTDGGTNWQPVTGTEITGFSAGAAVMIRIKETDTTYAGEAAALTIPAPPAVLTGISITKAPDKTTYTEGETFDQTGMVIDATYSDGSSKSVTDYEIAPFGALAATDTAVEIRYAENGTTKTASLDIHVDPPEPIAYKMILGMNRTFYTSADSAEFASDADFSKFVRVEIDGKELDGAHYEAKAGSTVITLKKVCISSLKAGVHTLEIVSSDGSAKTQFTIVAAPPQTGDRSSYALWLALLLISGSALAGMTAGRRKAE